MTQLNNLVLNKYLYIVKSNHFYKSIIIEEVGEETFKFIAKHADFKQPETFFISTTNHFNIRIATRNAYNTIINFRRINDIMDINKFLEVINEKLNYEGLFIGCAETNTLRHKRLIAKYIFPLNHVYYFFDFIFKRIFPKLPFTKKLYLLLTNGRNRVLSKVELIGRLYRSGFEVYSEKTIGSLIYFVAKKTKKPLYDKSPKNYPLIKLKRIGKNGSLINVYKIRTMHSYSEYLQEYIYKNNSIDKTGKFKNDFRISVFGKILRKCWIDELPMIFNLIKGDVKVFGVRPISPQYYSLYSEELKKERIKYKPGLIPPYYADLPRSIEEIMASEMKYLKLYSNSPFKTDLKYLGLAVFNILIKGARSK